MTAASQKMELRDVYVHSPIMDEWTLLNEAPYTSRAHTINQIVRQCTMGPSVS